jgi:chromosome segregation ATPase
VHLSFLSLETNLALQNLTKKHNGLVKEREELEHDKETFEKVVDKLRSDISTCEHTNKELLHKVRESIQRVFVCGGFNA